MELNISLDFNKLYVVACSFGPDSMALLNCMHEAGYKVVVAHVNYHKRDASNFEETSLKEWCQKRNIPCYVLDATGLNHKGNFQAWAREIRYDFFKKVADKYETKNIVVAHQKDDFIETYLMQEKRGICTKNAGIASEISLGEYKIYRPLLGYFKDELLKYDEEKNVPYSIDCSNLEDHYERNRVRHSLVEQMSEKEKEEIFKIASAKNKENEKFVPLTKFTINDIEKLDCDTLQKHLICFIESHNAHKNITKKFCENVLKSLKTKKSNFDIQIFYNLFITKSYNNVFLREKRTISYFYELLKGEKLDDNYFDIDFSLGAEDRNVFDEAYPITIKPISKTDCYKVSEYNCSVRRLFIDWKVPNYMRDRWPGIYDKNGSLIYIPRYREQFEDNHKSKFVIKSTLFE